METASRFTVSVDDSTGDYQFLVSDISSPLIDATSTVRRASHVFPWNPLLRVFFKVLRVLFGDKGVIARFTREWPCKWQVNLSPVNGPIIPIEWASRQSAINCEIQWLEDNFL